MAMLNSCCQLDWLKSAQELGIAHFWVCLWGLIQGTLTHRVRPTLAVSGTTPQASSPFRHKRGKKRKSMIIMMSFPLCVLATMMWTSSSRHRFPAMMNCSLWNNGPDKSFLTQVPFLKYLLLQWYSCILALMKTLLVPVLWEIVSLNHYIAGKRPIFLTIE